MLIRAKHLKGMGIEAKDGELGRVTDVYFDDQHWGIRYLIVDTGGWLSGRSVLISPRSVRGIDRSRERVQLDLMKEQVRHSPDVDTDKPVSRQREIDFDAYYGYPTYWGGPFLWGGSPYPGPLTAPAESLKYPDAPPEPPAARADPNLRSAKEIIGYHIQASDKALGHVDDFLIDDEYWAVRYLVVDTRNWWPGRQVLLSPEWVHAVDWQARQVQVSMTHEAVENSPRYDQADLPTRDYEDRLFAHYERKAYWLFHP